MRLAMLVSLGLGAIAVLQAAINRKVAAVWGLAPAVLLNTVVLLVVAGAFLGTALRGLGPFARFVAEDARLGQLRWWWVLPGLLGFALVAGLPWAVARVGALQVFVGVVAAQMVTSLFWDALVEGIPATGARALGAALAIVSVVLVAWR